jgi:hypothetical protein
MASASSPAHSRQELAADNKQALAEFRLEFFGGAEETAPLAEASHTQLVVAGPKPRTIPLADVIAFRRDAAAAERPLRTAELWLSNGDHLFVDILSANDAALSVRWSGFAQRQPWQIPLERVVTLLARSPPSSAARWKLLRSAALEQQRADVAWLVNGDRLAGEFVGFDGQTYQFDNDGNKLSVAREQLQALRLNPDLILANPPLVPRYVLRLSDGSRVTARRFALTPKTLSFQTAFDADAVLPASALMGVQVISDRIVPVSERTPERVDFTPYLGGAKAWVKDRNVLSGPLELRGREFGFGLGVHSRTALTYRLEPGDREFRAVVGIDDCANGSGDAVFSVLVDERRVWESPHVTGTSQPLVVPPIDLRGGKRLTLLVDFGELGDVGDYANWCDPVIVREPPAQ